MGIAMDQAHELGVDSLSTICVNKERNLVSGLYRNLVGVTKYLLLGHGG
jgi:hypothetical protein